MRRVIRPGPLQYACILLLPALPVAFGVATWAYGLGVEPADWRTRLPWAVGITLVGLFPAAFLLGMSVRLEPATVTKVYLFGLLRERIPLDRLAWTVTVPQTKGRASARPLS